MIATSKPAVCAAVRRHPAGQRVQRRVLTCDVLVQQLNAATVVAQCSDLAQHVEPFRRAGARTVSLATGTGCRKRATLEAIRSRPIFTASISRTSFGAPQSARSCWRS
jgi:hypothetical protein